MLEIKAIQDKTIQEQLCLECGIEYDADTLAYSIYDNDEPVGIVQFAIKGSCGMIYNISKSDDIQAIVTAIRAVFSFLDICGINDVYFKDAAYDEKLIKMFGFAKKDGTWYINLEGFFDTPCHP